CRREPQVPSAADDSQIAPETNCPAKPPRKTERRSRCASRIIMGMPSEVPPAILAQGPSEGTGPFARRAGRRALPPGRPGMIGFAGSLRSGDVRFVRRGILIKLPGLFHPTAAGVLGTALVLVAAEVVTRLWIVSPAASVPDARYGWT